jgi:hypothetical protein
MKFYKISILTFVLMFLQTVNYSQCTEETVGDLDAKNLAYSPSAIYSCSTVTVTAEWDVTSQWAYDADFHLSKFIISLPNEFVGTSAKSYSITASDEGVYWDLSTASLEEDEFQIDLVGLIPTGTNISIMIEDMNVEFVGPFTLFNVSQSISTVIADCLPQNDEQSINGFALSADGPSISEITSNCTSTEVGIDLTVSPGGFNGGAIVSYLWEGPEGFTSTEEDPIFAIDSSDPLAEQIYSGTYSVTVTDDKGCKSVGDIYLDAINCLVLPLELLSFDARASGEEALLEWKTAMELNNSHFEVERSQDGRTFTKIGEVKGGGTTSGIVGYSYIDKMPGAGKNYYRLKQVDYDGASTYTEIRAVAFEISEAIVLYPNPTSGEMRLEGVQQEWSKVEIYDYLGRLVDDTELLGNGTLDISELTPGMYQVRIKDFIGEEIYTTKVIKI